MSLDPPGTCHLVGCPGKPMPCGGCLPSRSSPQHPTRQELAMIATPPPLPPPPPVPYVVVGHAYKIRCADVPTRPPLLRPNQATDYRLIRRACAGHKVIIWRGR